MPFTSPGIILFLLFTTYLSSSPDNNFPFLKKNDITLNLTEKRLDSLQNVFTKAEFPGGHQALKNYINNNLIIPPIAFERRDNKAVVLGADIILRVGIDGSVKLLKMQKVNIQPNDPAVIQAVKGELITFLSKMPKWSPASRGGKPVVSLDTISFLENYAPEVTLAAYQKLKKMQPFDNSKNTFFSSSELRTRDGKQVFQFVQKQPAYPGGDQALKIYLMQHLPYLHQKQNSGDLVVMSLVINENGAAEDIIIIKPKGVILDGSETKNVLNKMPIWTPAKQHNKPVPFSYIFPIKY